MRYIRSFIFALLLCLPACSTTVSQPSVITYPPVTIPGIQPITASPVTVRIDAQGNGVVDQQSLVNMKLNLLDINRWIVQEKALVKMLEDVLAERSAKPSP